MPLNNRLLFLQRENFSGKQVLTGEVEPFAVQRQQRQTTKAMLTKMSTNLLRNNDSGYARAL